MTALPDCFIVIAGSMQYRFGYEYRYRFGEPIALSAAYQQSDASRPSVVLAPWEPSAGSICSL